MNPNEIHALRERAKELRCLYAVDAIVSDRGGTPARTFERVLAALPDGWQRPASTGARITYLGRRHVGPGFAAEGATLAVPLRLFGVEVGRVEVRDADPAAAAAGDGAFLPEEEELLRRVANRLGEYLERKHAELFGERPAATGHWAWRERFAEALADHLDPGRFGIERVFLGGSTSLGEASHGSDLDLYVLGDGDEAQRRDLAHWLEGWSLCLGEVALQQTGQPFPDGLLDVRWLSAPPDLARRPDLRELDLGARNGR